jgi:hypothetical protein
MRQKALNFLREISPNSPDSKAAKFLPYSIERDSTGKIIPGDGPSPMSPKHFFPKR